MAVQGYRPIQRKAEYYCFVPYATEIKTDYLSRRVEFVNPKDGRCKKCSIVHWGNQNTKKAEYKFEIYKMNTLRNNRSVYKWYCIEDMISEIGRGFIYKIIAVKQKAKKVFRD